MSLETAADGDELRQVLCDADEGRCTIEIQGDGWLGGPNVRFKLGNGWQVLVFNDEDSWDYIQSMTAPDGRVFELPESEEFVEADAVSVLSTWDPVHTERWGPRCPNWRIRGPGW